MCPRIAFRRLKAFAKESGLIGNLVCETIGTRRHITSGLAALTPLPPRRRGPASIATLMRCGRGNWRVPVICWEAQASRLCSGAVEFPIGNVGRDAGTLMFKGKFETASLITGKVEFSPLVGEKPSKHGTFEAARE
jgi:hypothetical protein